MAGPWGASVSGSIRAFVFGLCSLCCGDESSGAVEQMPETGVFVFVGSEVGVQSRRYGSVKLGTLGRPSGLVSSLERVEFHNDGAIHGIRWGQAKTVGEQESLHDR